MAKPVWSVERTGVCVTDHRGHKQPQVVATDTPTSGTAACLSGRGGGVATSISRNGITYETATASPAGTRLQSGFTNRGCNRYTNYRGFGFPSSNWAVRRPAASDHGVLATARAPSRTPLSQSASALLNVKVCNCGNEVHQNGASADTRLPSSILQQLVHLSLMLHACREWLYRQVSLLSGCLSRGSSTAARVLRQCRAMTRW